MPDVKLRRIHLKAKDGKDKAQVYTIAPSYVLPYMTGYSDEVEKALFLHENPVKVKPQFFWGKNGMGGKGQRPSAIEP